MVICVAKKVTKKRKFKWKVILRLVLLLFLAGMCYMYVQSLPTKHILIRGNDFVSDNEIITAIGYKNYPKLFEKTRKDLEDSIKSIDFVDTVKIKRDLLGNLTIDIVEAKPLFFNRNNNKVVLENKRSISRPSIDGIPMLINYVPDSYFEKLIEKLNLVNTDVRHLISEIEYQPWKSNDVMIDETRFFLRMSDTNSVYVNLLHMEKLNNYIEIYASLEGKNGILYLDSSSDKISFSEYGSDKREN